MRLLSIFFLMLLMATGCISNKRITYLQNLSDSTSYALDEFIPFAEVDYKYVLQPFDIVEIDFASSDEELTTAFTFQNSRGGGLGMMGGGGGQGSDPLYFRGFSIDQAGYVEVPKLGKIKIAGLTEEEAKEKIQSGINEFFKEEVFVRLRIAGIRYTTLGEFNSVGVKIIYKNRATIFDALANSGETTLLGKKNKLFIIRQYDGGSKIHQINLNDRALLASPFYFIQPNDILYMEPMKIRQIGSADNLASGLALFGGLLASTLLLLNLFIGGN
ncbi:MAG TPA: sugar transporter [Algoriphagus sp.]|jgi:polysaccharide export outer membrane protein|uniref:polysaccharide biosynthesis/export family protein n=2 Tax=Algoriphagus TaxID=246875 RepID=UPI000C5E4DBA|nr:MULTISPECIES: polysaccharide biosynthesis/export family protein [unclassified Algoriphagus]MAL14379.1 sugar transporter [Algoriphagus sp.]HAS59471.1 sugar transporter [Algoriphagus sp.]HAZ25256.1 sugar transporter [Algoriphagus sp.]HCX74864.1 sugar transporter [Algoriphagus sp.]|tara:strand:- start:615 stop:1433 length:819 start_codon:yes stop_codon:yes gene_type:complete